MTKRIRRAGLADAWKALGAAANGLRDYGLFVVYFNVLWLLACIPLITAPPATAALYSTMRALVYGRSPDWRSFLRDARAQFFVGWRWGLLNLAAAFLILVNLWFYGLWAAPIGPLLRGVWLGLTLAWLTVQMFCFPLLLEQKQPSVRLALRNAVVLILHHPVFTLACGLLSGFLVFMTWVVPYFLLIFTVALLMVLHLWAVRYLWRTERGLPGIPQPGDPPYA